MAHTELQQLADERYVMTSRTKMWVLALIVVGAIFTTIGIISASSGDSHHDTHTTAAAGHDSHSEGHDAAKADAHHSEQEATAHNAIEGKTDADAHEVDPTETAHGDGHHEASWTKRLWSNLLINGWFFLLISIMGTFFIAVSYLANAGWYTAVKRIPEAMGSFLPIAAILVFIPLIFGAKELYHWMHDGVTDPESPIYDAIIAGKSGFLNSGFLYIGTFIILAIFVVYTYLLRQHSLKEDEVGGLDNYKKSIRKSAAFTILFAVSFSILSWLVMMSVDVHWFSTIYSVYNFATGFVSGFAVITLILIFLQSQGYLSFVTEEVRHDLGKFMFAFTIFWTYIWISQYLLIWYANIPEEVTYYAPRFQGIYSGHFWLNIFLCFFFPFLWFMTRNNKRKDFPLIVGSIVILIGHWSDVYLLVTPGVMQENNAFGLLEIGLPLLFAGLYIYVVLTALGKANLFPKNHPYLHESVLHDVGP